MGDYRNGPMATSYSDKCLEHSNADASIVHNSSEINTNDNYVPQGIEIEKKCAMTSDGYSIKQVVRARIIKK